MSASMELTSVTICSNALAFVIFVALSMHTNAMLVGPAWLIGRYLLLADNVVHFDELVDARCPLPDHGAAVEFVCRRLVWSALSFCQPTAAFPPYSKPHNNIQKKRKQKTSWKLTLSLTPEWSVDLGYQTLVSEIVYTFKDSMLGNFVFKDDMPCNIDLRHRIPCECGWDASETVLAEPSN